MRNAERSDRHCWIDELKAQARASSDRRDRASGAPASP